MPLQDARDGRNPASLAFRKERSGCYYATDGAYQYSLMSSDKRAGRGRWLLQVRELTTTAGVTHALGQPVIDHAVAATKAEMAAVANAYSTFGESYRQSGHGGMERMTAAITAAYDEMTAAAAPVPARRRR